MVENQTFLQKLSYYECLEPYGNICYYHFSGVQLNGAFKASVNNILYCMKQYQLSMIEVANYLAT